MFIRVFIKMSSMLYRKIVPLGTIGACFANRVFCLSLSLENLFLITVEFRSYFSSLFQSKNMFAFVHFRGCPFAVMSHKRKRL